jgi:hypothetical protein
MYELFNKYIEQYKENSKNAQIVEKKILETNYQKKITEENIKNLDKGKIDRLVDNWNKTIAKLENIKAPQKIQESAKEMRKDLIDHIKSLQKSKPKFNEAKRNQILEKLKQDKEKSRGRER